ncbi:MAG: hypothetical protein JSS66_13105 [Armatimonadetes bacterium]|nr:hypothetical protein [Armatimonadota bacterium]
MNLAILTIALAGSLAMPQENVSAKRNNQLVIEWMSKHLEQGGQIVNPLPIDDACMLRLVPLTFHSLRYREYPVIVAGPKPMAQRNVFMVDRACTVHVFTKREALRKDFLAQKVSASGVSAAREVALAYARASSEFSQDGFFQFLYEYDRTSGQKDGDRIVAVAKAPVVERSGDKGALVVTVTFVSTQVGKWVVQDIVEKDTVQPGVRPICQCTLLLDPNPIVRKMAERDLLVMGRAAFPYMAEQEALAGPELQKEIQRVRQRILRGER